MKRTASLLAAGVLGLALAGCSGGGDAAAGGSTTTTVTGSGGDGTSSGTAGGGGDGGAGASTTAGGGGAGGATDTTGGEGPGDDGGSSSSGGGGGSSGDDLPGDVCDALVEIETATSSEQPSEEEIAAFLDSAGTVIDEAPDELGDAMQLIVDFLTDVLAEAESSGTDFDTASTVVFDRFDDRQVAAFSDAVATIDDAAAGCGVDVGG